ncbi:MAG: DUF4832 domain-containing protein [Clostridia bacterium]|nr:DUF4832 domain-containing protein [Clostridia bacterium]
MKNQWVITIVAAVIITLSVCFTFVACNKNKLNIAEYDATSTQFDYALDTSIPFVNIENAPKDNASRGFRGETYITLGANEAYPGSGENYMEKLENELEILSKDDVRLMQVYVYLIEFYNTDIPQSAFDQLKEYFEIFQSKGIKMLLRFAYETSEGQKNGPKTSDIVRHCAQIKGFINENITLFNNTVYAVQMGLIGLWGEGHGSVHKHSVAKVARAFADAIPQNIPLMVRTPQMISELDKEIEARFGMHEDYVIGYNDPWVAIATNDKYYQDVINKCKYAVTDGEMPWGRANVPINTLGAIKTCVDFAMSSFSLAHNYIEEGGEYALKKWQSEYLTEETLKDNNFPYNPNLLTDGKISAFEYLKYHLGYQLVASNLKIENGKMSFMITNYGFACPYGYDMRVYVNGKSATLYEQFDYTDLLQFSQKVYTIDYLGGDIEIEFVNMRDENDKIRLFNDIPFVNGRNVIFSQSCAQ